MATPINQNVFDSLSEYQIRILFSSWYTRTVWQFLSSCVAVFVFTMSFHLLKWWKKTLYYRIYRSKWFDLNCKSEEEQQILLNTKKHLSSSPPDRNTCTITFGYFMISLVQSALLMFLVMILMTFNPWIFISMLLGHFTGELIVFSKIIEKKVNMNV